MMDPTLHMQAPAWQKQLLHLKKKKKKKKQLVKLVGLKLFSRSYQCVPPHVRANRKEARDGLPVPGPSPTNACAGSKEKEAHYGLGPIHTRAASPS